MSRTLGKPSSNSHTSGANITGQPSNYFPILSSAEAPLGINLLHWEFLFRHSHEHALTAMHSLPAPDGVTSHKLCFEFNITTSPHPNSCLGRFNKSVILKGCLLVCVGSYS